MLRTVLKGWINHPAFKTFLSVVHCMVWNHQYLNIKVIGYSITRQSTFKKQVCFHCSCWTFNISLKSSQNFNILVKNANYRLLLSEKTSTWRRYMGFRNISFIHVKGFRNVEALSIRYILENVIQNILPDVLLYALLYIFNETSTYFYHFQRVTTRYH